MPDVHPPIGKQASGEASDKHRPIQLHDGHRAVMHHALKECLFQYMLGGKQHFHQSDQHKDRCQVTVCPHLGLKVRVANRKHTPQAKHERHGCGKADPADDRAMPPVVIIAIVEDKRDFQGKRRPKHRSQPIDAEQGEFLEHTEMARADGQYQQIHHHDAADEQLHVVPMEVIHQISGQQIGQLHTPQDNDMQHGEEHGEVAGRTHPKLDVRHALKRALYLAHTFNEAYQPKQRKESDMRRNQIAEQYPGSRPTQQCLVRETELHAEQQREINGHPCQVRVQTHKKVFPHQGRLAHHLVQGSEIQPAGELERNGDENVYPRPCLLRYKPPEHRHGERHGPCSFAHISIPLCILH